MAAVWIQFHCCSGMKLEPEVRAETAGLQSSDEGTITCEELSE